MDQQRRARSFNVSIENLTRRERELINLLAQGLLNKEIAYEMDITERTIKNMLVKLYDKLGYNNRTEVAVYAVRNGIC